MKQYSYDELKAEVERNKKEKSNILGPCCNCGADVIKGEFHRTHFFYPPPPKEWEPQYACKNCEIYEDELRVFFSLLNCVQGTKSWDVFDQLKNK